MVEQILGDLAASAPGAWRVALLRYFKSRGRAPERMIGEDPQGIPNNLMPNIAQVAVGVRDRVRVFGSDYPTRDGTGIRDYIHVVDLARGHIAALEALQRERHGITVNLGTGQGISVLEAVRAFSARAAGPYPSNALLGARATWPNRMRTRHWRRDPSAGRPSTGSMTCAAIHGDGKARTPTLQREGGRSALRAS